MLWCSLGQTSIFDNVRSFVSISVGLSFSALPMLKKYFFLVTAVVVFMFSLEKIDLFSLFVTVATLI